MDDLQGANTEKQICLLKTVSKLKNEKKDITAIILGSKVDCPDNGKQQALLEESRAKAIEILGDGCLQTKHQTIIGRAYSPGHGNTLVPCLAANAFVY